VTWAPGLGNVKKEMIVGARRMGGKLKRIRTQARKRGLVRQKRGWTSL